MTKWASYAEFLKSPEWQKLRKEALAKAENRCQLCNSKHRLEVHHRTYRARWGEEKPTDLTVLCNDCHTRFSKRKPVPKPKGKPTRSRVERELAKIERIAKRQMPKSGPVARKKIKSYLKFINEQYAAQEEKGGV